MLFNESYWNVNIVIVRDNTNCSMDWMNTNWAVSKHLKKKKKEKEKNTMREMGENAIVPKPPDLFASSHVDRSLLTLLFWALAERKPRLSGI